MTSSVSFLPRPLATAVTFLILLSYCSCLPLHPNNTVLIGYLSNTDAALGPAVEEALQLAVRDINESKDLLPNVKLALVTEVAESPSDALKFAMKFIEEERVSFLAGPNFSSHSLTAGVAGATLDRLLMGLGTSEELNAGSYYNYFRTTPHDAVQCQVLVRLLLEYGWSEVGVISGYDAYSIGLTRCFQATVGDHGIRILGTTFFSINDSDELTKINIQVLQNTGARVFILTLQTFEYREWIKAALEMDFVGEPYNWVYVETGYAIYTDEHGKPNKDMASYAKGTFVTGPSAGTNLDLRKYVQAHTPSDPSSIYTGYGYDGVMACARAMHYLMQEQGMAWENVTTTDLRAALVEHTSFQGVSGRVEFDQDGNRKFGLFSVWNHQGKPEAPPKIWDLFGLEGDIKKYQSPLFSNGKSEPPSSAPSLPKKYYDCSREEVLDDPKGEVMFQPIGDRPDLLPESNYCDGIVDCTNWSDEGFHCSPSLAVGYVVFGACAVLASLVFLGGSLYLTVHRSKGIVRAMGMPYLWVFTFTSVLGMLTVFTVIGPAEDASCQLRIWLPGVLSSLLVGTLSAKQYRVVRIFGSKSLRSIKISTAQLGIIVLIIIVPDLVVLTVWTAADTYQAKAESNDENIICQSSYEVVFLIILLVYKGLLLAVLSVMAFISRKFPAKYSEAQQLGLAIYNTTLITAILIPITLAFTNNFAQYLFGTLFLFTFFFCPYIFICVPKIYALNSGKLEAISQTSRSSHSKAEKTHSTEIMT